MNENNELSFAITISGNSLIKAGRFIDITKKLINEITLSNSSNPYDKINLVDLLINKTKNDVYEIFGQPTKNKNATETYFNEGLIFKYDNENKIIYICATHLINGVFYKGKLIYKIGENINKSEGLSEQNASYNYSNFGVNKISVKENIFFHKDYALEVEVWDEKDTNKKFGDFPIGEYNTIKRIVFRKRNKEEIPEDEKTQNRKLAEYLHKYWQGENLDVDASQQEKILNIERIITK